MQSNDIESTTAAVAMTNDGFRWSRVWMVASYWWPLLRWKMLVFLLFSILAGLTTTLFYTAYGDYTSFQITGLCAYLCIFGCAVFGKKAGRQMGIGLPARNSEKLTFLLIFNLIILPLITVVPCSLVMMIGMGEWPEQMAQTILGSVGLKDIGEFYWVAQFYSTGLMMLSSLVCLWTATTARRSAFGKAIGFSLLTFFLPSLSTGLFAGIEGFRQTMDHVGSVEEMMNQMFSLMDTVFKVCSIVIAAAWAGCLYLFIRNFNRRQC